MSSSLRSAFAFPVLVADIGGTNARFALVETPESDFVLLPQIATASTKGVAEAIERAAFAGETPRPKTAIMAIAGPIAGDRVPLTNCPWVIEPKALIDAFGFENVVLVNDFEAQALALPALGEADLAQIGGGSAQTAATKAVIGPGTGLGVGVLVHALDHWIPIPGEGGHVTLGPDTVREAAIWPHLETIEGRVSGETILSGPGLERLHRAILTTDGRPPVAASAAEISAAAAAGDPVAVEVLEIFASALGRLAGDLALTVLPRGGVHLGGGIPPRLLPALSSGRFRAAFEAKAPHRALVSSISTRVVIHPRPALVGLSAYARRPDLFAVDLGGRIW